jgi:hypothetical protein
MDVQQICPLPVVFNDLVSHTLRDRMEFISNSAQAGRLKLLSQTVYLITIQSSNWSARKAISKTGDRMPFFWETWANSGLESMAWNGGFRANWFRYRSGPFMSIAQFFPLYLYPLWKRTIIGERRNLTMIGRSSGDFVNVLRKREWWIRKLGKHIWTKHSWR